MSETTIQVFIDGVIHYFQHTSHKDVKIGSPYLVDNLSPKAYDYTGVIGVTGPYRGTVYFTAPKALLTHLLLSLGEKDVSIENILDVVGEVANTISGNARSTFGHEFLITVPIVVEGIPTSIHFPKNLRSYVIPLQWRSYNAAVVVCLEGK